MIAIQIGILLLMAGLIMVLALLLNYMYWWKLYDGEHLTLAAALVAVFLVLLRIITL